MSSESRDKKVLIIDDTLMIRKLLVAVLGQQGFSVFEAEDGSEGLKQIDSDRPDIILCDLFMPGMNGRQFLQEFGSSANKDTIPIIILSADVETALEEELLKLGANSVVDKGAPHAELIAKMNELIAKK